MKKTLKLLKRSTNKKRENVFTSLASTDNAIK